MQGTYITNSACDTWIAMNFWSMLYLDKKKKELMLWYYKCGLGFFMLIVHILTNLHLHMADTMQFYIKQTHWITLIQICTNEKKLVLLSVS